jgi:YHS domain-containing protein
MKARWIVMLLAVVMLVVGGQFISAQQESAALEEKEFEATCPVSGQPAIEDSVVDLKNGAKVYFCCKNCPKAYAANPEKFALKVGRQLLETGQVVQVACPITGQPVNEETLVEVGKAKAGFCCKNCLGKYNKADDDGKLEILFAKLGEGEAFTRQTKCPVSGKPIGAEFALEHEGKQVYFCCPNCPKAFEANPAKFMAKLPQFAKDAGEFAPK